MGEYSKKIFGQISDFLKTLSPLKKVAMVVIGAGIIVGMTLVAYWAGETTYVPLMTGLNPEDSASVMRVLREKRISFKVDPTGKNISIPPESVFDLRLELATLGMPQSGVVGYEVFDKQTLGTTNFVQKMNQKRAIEGELMRTINTMKGVKRSRVHLAIPQKTAFVEDQKKTTASVALDIEPGTVLNERQIFGIGNLVARAVEGLEVTDVVIVDSNGRVLSKNPADPIAAATATQLDFQSRIEADLEHRVEDIMSKIVGEGHVVAKVSAELDFSQVNETQTTYDPDGTAVRSVEKRSDSANGTRPGPYGLAGAASNQPGQPPAANGEVKTETVRNNEVVNNEVPTTVKRTVRPTGQVKRLSVAVVVDGKPVRAPASAGKDAKTENQAWSAEKLKEFEAVIANTVGIDRKRGDTLEVRNMEFARIDFEEAGRVIAEKERKSYVQQLVLYGVIGLTILMFFMFVVRPFIKWVTENTIDSVDTFLPQTIEELERLQKNATLPGMEEAVPIIAENLDPQKVEGEMIKEKIITLVEANPHKAALIVRDWLHSEKKKAAAPAEPGKDATA